MTAETVPDYDPADFPGFTPEQIEAGLTVPVVAELLRDGEDGR